MARFDASLPDDLIKLFEELEINTEQMLGEMVTAGAEVARANIWAKMPRAFADALSFDNVILTRVYKTPSDDGINCQAMIYGYFKNEYGEETPAPLTETVFVTLLPSPRGANELIDALYTRSAFAPAGTFIPLITRGGPAVTVG